MDGSITNCKTTQRTMLDYITPPMPKKGRYAEETSGQANE